MTRTISGITLDDANEIMHSIYDNDKGATFSGRWPERHVHGSVVTARTDSIKGLFRVTITSNALSTQAGLNEYLPKRFQQ